jgi:D-alanine-D-alanine ligase
MQVGCRAGTISAVDEITLPALEGIPEPRDVRVLVVYGGTSSEAEVSRSSGRAVVDALSATYPNVEVAEPTVDIATTLADGRVDVVFPVLHGPLGEDGAFQGLLEVAGVPYVGCDVLASACTLDKVVTKRIFRDLGLPTPRDVVVNRSDDPAQAARAVRDELGERVVVKPAAEGSAVGVEFASTEAELADALATAFRYGPRALVEERIDGAEISVGILETDRTRAGAVIEVRTPEGSWYDYEHRYTEGLSEHVIPAPMAEDTYRTVQDLAVRAHDGLGCRDMSRIDFVVTAAGDAYLLEVNALPGMTPTSLYPDSLKGAGISFEDLCAYAVGRALARGRSR